MTTWLSSWRRLLSTTGVCFALFFGLLAWRVAAGEDPVLTSSTTTQTTTSSPSPSSGTTGQPSTTPDTSTTPTTQAS